jgi:hypothetical protein
VSPESDIFLDYAALQAAVKDGRAEATAEI